MTNFGNIYTCIFPKGFRSNILFKKVVFEYDWFFMSTYVHVLNFQEYSDVDIPWGNIYTVQCKWFGDTHFHMSICFNGLKFVIIGEKKPLWQ